MHHIQTKILDKLNHTETLKFGELRIDGVESNLFTYHLKQLIKDGYLAKENAAYTLTPKGIFHIDRYSARLSGIRLQPKIITMIDLRDENGKSLIVRRLYQPFINKISYPSGKQHLEEGVVESGLRELKEKAGVGGIGLKHVGEAHLIVYRKDQLVGQYLVHILYADCKQADIDTAYYARTNRWAKPFWADIDDLREDECTTGLKDMKMAVDKNDSFFFIEKEYREK